MSQFTIVLSLQTVVINRGAESIGMGIMGGSDRPTHVFRQGEKPGVFVREVSSFDDLMPFVKSHVFVSIRSKQKELLPSVVKSGPETVYYQ